MRRDPRRARLVLTLLLLTAFTFLTVEVRQGRSGPLHPVRNGLSKVFSPVTNALGDVFSPVGDAFSAAVHSKRDKHRRDQLQGDLLKLQQQYDQLKQNVADDASIKALQDLEFRGAYTIVPSTVIAVGSPVEDFSQVVTIDVGLVDHIKDGDAVVTGDGLVGRVIDAQAKKSTVLLVTDTKFSVGVQFVDTAQDTAIETVQGQGQGQLLLFKTTNDALLTKGQRLITYPAGLFTGIPVGTIETITPGRYGQTATVRPYAHLDGLDVVGVVVEHDRDGPTSALSPSPSPSPPAPPSPKGTPSGSASPGAKGTTGTTGAGSSPTPSRAVTVSGTPTP